MSHTVSSLNLDSFHNLTDEQAKIIASAYSTLYNFRVDETYTDYLKMHSLELLYEILWDLYHEDFMEGSRKSNRIIKDTDLFPSNNDKANMSSTLSKRRDSYNSQEKSRSKICRTDILEKSNLRNYKAISYFSDLLAPTLSKVPEGNKRKNPNIPYKFVYAYVYSYPRFFYYKDKYNTGITISNLYDIHKDLEFYRPKNLTAFEVEYYSFIESRYYAPAQFCNCLTDYLSPERRLTSIPSSFIELKLHTYFYNTPHLSLITYMQEKYSGLCYKSDLHQDAFIEFITWSSHLIPILKDKIKQTLKSYGSIKDNFQSTLMEVLTTLSEAYPQVSKYYTHKIECAFKSADSCKYPSQGTNSSTLLNPKKDCPSEEINRAISVLLYDLPWPQKYPAPPTPTAAYIRGLIHFDALIHPNTISSPTTVTDFLLRRKNPLFSYYY